MFSTFTHITDAILHNTEEKKDRRMDDTIFFLSLAENIIHKSNMVEEEEWGKESAM